MNVFKMIRDNASTILSMFAIGGVVGTAVLTARAVIRADKAVSKAKYEAVEQGKHPTWRETVAPVVKECVAPTVTGLATIGCIASANLLSRRRQATLMATYIALDQAFRNYRASVASLGGETLDHCAMRNSENRTRDNESDAPPWDTAQTFRLEGYPYLFDTTMENVCDAEYILNRNFILRGCATFNELLRLLKLKDMGDSGELIGWEEYSGEVFYGYRWIDFNHKHRMEDGTLICEITMPFGPHSLSEDADLMAEDTEHICGVE